eukprot:3808417-Pyramimonas_sp.AAC.1
MNIEAMSFTSALRGPSVRTSLGPRMAPPSGLSSARAPLNGKARFAPPAQRGRRFPLASQNYFRPEQDGIPGEAREAVDPRRRAGGLSWPRRRSRAGGMSKSMRGPTSWRTWPRAAPVPVSI